MEQERLAKEAEEKERAEKTKQIKESFGDATSQWEMDKTGMQDMALKDEKKKSESASDDAKLVGGGDKGTSKGETKDTTKHGKEEA